MTLAHELDHFQLHECVCVCGKEGGDRKCDLISDLVKCLRVWLQAFLFQNVWFTDSRKRNKHIIAFFLFCSLTYSNQRLHFFLWIRGFCTHTHTTCQKVKRLEDIECIDRVLPAIRHCESAIAGNVLARDFRSLAFSSAKVKSDLSQKNSSFHLHSNQCLKIKDAFV